MDKITIIRTGTDEGGDIEQCEFTSALHAAVEVIARTVISPAGSWPDQPQATCCLIEEIRKSSGVSHNAARAAIGQAVGAFNYIGSLALVADCKNSG
jgi:hypothetical protein